MIKRKQYLIISFIVLIVSGYFTFLFAQEVEEKRVEPYFPKKSKGECLKEFDINNINFKDPKVIRNIPLLVDYFQCRAVVRDDINECNNLSSWPGRIEPCRVSFNEYHGFFGRLLREGRISHQTLTACMNSFGLNREDCRLFGEAFLANDTSICEKFRNNTDRYNECKAFISGNERLCKTGVCKNKAIYIKAIKSSDIKECEKITGPFSERVKLMCQGYISMDEKICEKNKGFEEFRNKYCE